MIRSRTSIAKWNLFFHYSATVISIFNGIVIVPFYLKFIDHGLFGAWLATGNVLVWLTIVEPGVGDVLQQRVSAAMGANDKDLVGKFIFSGILISVAISLVVLLFSLLVQHFIPDILNLNSAINQDLLLTSFLIAAFGTSFTMLSYAFVGSNQGLQSSLGIGLIYVIVNIASLALNVILLFKGYGLLSIAYSTLLRGVGICFGNGFYLVYRIIKQQIKLQFSKTFFLSFSKLFSYTFMSKISTTIVSNLDLILVARFVNPEMVTMLELTRRPIRIVQGFTDRVSSAFMTPLSHLNGEGNYDKIKSIFIRFIYVYIWISTFIIFGFVSLNQYLLTIWAGKTVFLGNSLNILLCFTLWVGSILYNFSNFSYALGNIKGNSTNAILKSIVYLILIAVLGYFFGVYGVVISSLIAILASEAWYYPSILNKYLHFKRSEVKAFTNETLKVLLIGVLVSSSFLIYKPAIDNWFVLIIWSGIYALAFSILLIPASAKLQIEIKGIYLIMYAKFKTRNLT